MPYLNRINHKGVILIWLLLTTLPIIPLAEQTMSSDLFLWDVDFRTIENIELIFEESTCSTVPALVAGKAYRIKLRNHSGKNLSTPLPMDFIRSVKPLAINMAGMRLDVASFEGIEITDQGVISLELVPLESGQWQLGCAERKITIKEAAYPFPSKQPPVDSVQDLLKVPKPISRFELIKSDRTPFNESHIKNRWTLLFFGYTYCPDICPTSLFSLASAYKQLGDRAKGEVDIVFVSVDPERDTPESLKDYVKHFNSKLIGVTGDSKQLSMLADQVAASYRLPRDRTDKAYAVSHTADYFLLSPDQRLVARISHERTPSEIAETIQRARAYLKQLSTVSTLEN